MQQQVLQIVKHRANSNFILILWNNHVKETNSKLR